MFKKFRPARPEYYLPRRRGRNCYLARGRIRRVSTTKGRERRWRIFQDFT